MIADKGLSTAEAFGRPNEFRDRGDRRRPDPTHRHRTVPVRAPPHHASRGLGRSMAVLRAAPVRDDILGTRRRVDISRGGPARKLALRPPRILRWFTANIGVHHIHHLCSRIPYYRLPLVLRDYPDLSSIGRLTLVESFRCVRLVLWDEGQQRLVSFREVRQRYALV